MWRYVIGAVVMVTVSTQGDFPRMAWRETVRFIVLGGGGQALLVGLALSSVPYLGVATTAFLSTYPAWVTLVQIIRGAEQHSGVITLPLSFDWILRLTKSSAFVHRRWVSLLLPLPFTGIALASAASSVVYGMYIPLMQWMQKSHPVSVTSAYAKNRIGVLLSPIARARKTASAHRKLVVDRVDGDHRFLARAVQHRAAVRVFTMLVDCCG